MGHFEKGMEVGGLVAVGAMALIGSILAPEGAYDGLFGVLGALGGFIAGRMNGQTAAQKEIAHAIQMLPQGRP